MTRTASAGTVLAAAVAATLAGRGATANTVDGTVATVEYSTVLATQNNPTGFGDNKSELNQALSNYAPGGGLDLALTGNLEGNGNGLVIFIDSKAGGAINNSVGGGFGQFGSVGGARVDDWGTDTDGGAAVTPTPGGGSIVSPNFNPDYALEINAGGGGANYYINVIDLTQPNDDTHPNKDIFLGSNTTGGPAVTQTYTRDGGATIVGDVTHAFNNSNTAGVTDTDASGAATATTGFEFLLSKEFLARDPGHALRLLSFITNDNGGFLSNQFLPGLGGIGNLGGPGVDGGTPLLDSRFLGDQYYLDVFTPTTAATTGTWGSLAFTGTDVPNGAEQAARVTGSAAATLSIGTGLTLGYLKLDNTAGVTLNGAPGTMNFNGGNGAAVLLATAGTNAINALVNIPTDTRVDVSGGASVAFNSGMSMANGKTLTKAGGGTLTLNGSQFHGSGSSVAVDAGTLNLNSDLGASAATAADRPNLYVAAGADAAANLSSSQHLNQVAANPRAVITLAAGHDKVLVANEVFIEAPTGDNPPPRGRIDLKDNNMIVKTTPTGSWNGTAYTGVTEFVASGRGDGSWNGGGIVTSVAGAADYTTLGVASAADVKGLSGTATDTWNGQPVSAGDTLVMYTYGGDANLDGVVNIDDYTQIDSSVSVGGALKGWFNGDFNYDGNVDIDDYTIIDSNIGIQGPPLGTSAGAGAMAGVTAVPEPASVSLMGLGAAALIGRRRRRARQA